MAEIAYCHNFELWQRKVIYGLKKTYASKGLIYIHDQKSMLPPLGKQAKEWVQF